MTTKILQSGIPCGALLATAVAGALTSTEAQAGGAKEFFSQDYKFDRPMHGFEGQQGNYYCSYQRIPDNVRDRDGRYKGEGLDPAPALLSTPGLHTMIIRMMDNPGQEPIPVRDCAMPMLHCGRVSIRMKADGLAYAGQQSTLFSVAPSDWRGRAL